MDLFGDAVTQPQCTALSKATINAAHGFAEFWKAWPAGTRKVGKQQALNKWARYECANSASHILAHVEWLKKQDDWLRENGRFVPMPCTYLNQQRWIDWEPEPERKTQPDALAVIKAHKGAAPSAEVRQKLAELRRVIPNAKHAQQG